MILSALDLMVSSDHSYSGTIFSSPEPKVNIYDGHAPASAHRRTQFQRSSPLKPLGQSKPNFMWSILRKGEQKYI